MRQMVAPCNRPLTSCCRHNRASRTAENRESMRQSVAYKIDCLATIAPYWSSRIGRSKAGVAPAGSCCNAPRLHGMVQSMSRAKRPCPKAGEPGVMQMLLTTVCTAERTRTGAHSTMVMPEARPQPRSLDNGRTCFNC